MIREINLNDITKYNELGQNLNHNFEKLFDLKKTLEHNYNKIYVYEDVDILGFIHIQISFDSADIINIVVDEKKQGLGIGSHLLNYAIKENNLKEINIEVRTKSKAVDFYLKNKFKIIRTIPKYYENDDAYFMKKVIK